MMQRRRWATAAAARIAALMVTLFAAGCGGRPVALHGTALSGTAPPIDLQRGDGRPFSLLQMRGSVVALFFGYTHCTDVCPTTLAKLAQARKRLPVRLQARTKILFISIDPVRDTPSKTAAYGVLFGPGVSGLSGTPAQILRVQKAYHIWAQRLPGNGRAGDYEMAHSSEIYLIDGNGAWREILPWDVPVNAAAADFAALQS